MTITREEVIKIASLAKLQFSESELDAFTAQFEHILGYIEKLREVNIEGIDPTSHIGCGDGMARLRPDLAQPSLTAGEALQNAPDQGCDHFRVPAVLVREESNPEGC